MTSRSRQIKRKDWEKLAKQRLAQILKSAQLIPGLKRKGPKAPWQSSIALVGRAEMTRLNSQYRKKVYPTDVLSFPAVQPFKNSGILGDLVICLPVMKAQAKEAGTTLKEELDILLVHGILHLLGFDHEEGPAQEKEMGRWEQRLLNKGSVNRSLINRVISRK